MNWITRSRSSWFDARRHQVGLGWPPSSPAAIHAAGAFGDTGWRFGDGTFHHVGDLVRGTENDLLQVYSSACLGMRPIRRQLRRRRKLGMIAVADCDRDDKPDMIVAAGNVLFLFLNDPY